MNETVTEWVAKADDDYRVAVREFEAHPNCSFDAVCFHAQQCAEKSIKAVLIHRGMLAERTHNLVTLSRTLAESETGWRWNESELNALSRGAVRYRYPGDSANREDAAAAIDCAGRLRKALLVLIEPDVPSDKIDS